MPKKPVSVLRCSSPVARPRSRVSKAERAALAERTAAVTATLARVYPDAYCELDHSNPLELLIATILSAQCTDKRVNLVTKALFQRCRTALDYAQISQEELGKLVQST